ncbi:biotin carboxyl carrier protein of acetyl-CoA carboxylase 1, chloroplastic-like [Impatiens glandulifera]|uniref:biotin carboxyl carrier protein of acetyl-CoA carboxylase 1, chloroplastic-like n=1 Tax=Impatiens glandulifera TaxID=253017 RepID=UPI001FB10A42|nr:biotin carboxyl carrier protein of acetyl-CoA carboxylase 1, chloroplastic-like [Impatiens glandulifera]
MASAFPTTASAASAAAAAASKDCPPSSSRLSTSNRLHTQRKVSFLLSSMPSLRFSSKGLQSGWNVCTVRKGQPNKAALGGSLNATTPLIKAELETEDKAANSSSVTSSPALASEESISEFIGQVANLVKLVDSRDIVELQLKQLDCELLIRKKEALPQSASPAPSYVMHSPPPTAAAPTFHDLPPPATPSPSAPSPSSPPASSPPAAKSSLPSLKSPMAGTFYRSPAPTEPPFVKVGDKVQKGQVLCIIEAMKLMNEIEADQSGTIVEIIAEDGKPVSVDTPLFVIES